MSGERGEEKGVVLFAVLLLLLLNPPCQSSEPIKLAEIWDVVPDLVSNQIRRVLWSRREVALRCTHLNIYPCQPILSPMVATINLASARLRQRLLLLARCCASAHHLSPFSHATAG